uniref:Olfactory receptor n=1 Tax=Pogona vitticeps TaxID=103695 RepID=A0ABM5GPY5_9SAUR
MKVGTSTVNLYAFLHRMIQENDVANQSIIKGFLLMGFSSDHNLQMMYFLIFLSIYLIALIGNFLIIATVALNYSLHTPMYGFLVNLSIIDVCYITTIVPKTISVCFMGNNLISFFGCVAQIFSVMVFVGAEISLLTVMAYDRYVAICHPLQYRLIMNWKTCIYMATAFWSISVIHAVLETTVTFSLSFCGPNILEQFFCDVPSLLKISCTNTQVNKVIVFVIGSIVNSFCILFISVSYGYIFSTVLRIPADQGRYKVFSTCIPHMTVSTLFVTTALFSHMKPSGLSSPMVNLLSGVLYTVLPPMLNPIIYCLRNKEIQEAMWKILKKYNFHTIFS